MAYPYGAPGGGYGMPPPGTANAFCFLGLSCFNLMLITTTRFAPAPRTAQIHTSRAANPATAPLLPAKVLWRRTHFLVALPLLRCAPLDAGGWATIGYGMGPPQGYGAPPQGYGAPPPQQGTPVCSPSDPRTLPPHHKPLVSPPVRLRREVYAGTAHGRATAGHGHGLQRTAHGRPARRLRRTASGHGLRSTARRLRRPSARHGRPAAGLRRPASGLRTDGLSSAGRRSSARSADDVRTRHTNDTRDTTHVRTRSTS